MRSVYISGSVQENNKTVDGNSEEAIMQSLARDVACLIQRRTCGEVVVYLNRPEWSLSEIIADSNQKNPLLHIALHSNAGGGTGTETWCYGFGTNSCRFGSLIQKKVVSVLGLKDRGIKEGKSLAEVIHTHATSVVCELFFHDNQLDMDRFYSKRAELVDAIGSAVLEWFGIPWENNSESLNRENLALRKALASIREALINLENELKQGG